MGVIVYTDVFIIGIVIPPPNTQKAGASYNSGIGGKSLGCRSRFFMPMQHVVGAGGGRVICKDK